WFQGAEVLDVLEGVGRAIGSRPRSGSTRALNCRLGIDAHTRGLGRHGMQWKTSAKSAASAKSLSAAPQTSCGAMVTIGCPTLRMASKTSRGVPHSELMKMAVTLTAIATIAQIGWMNPVAAIGIPIPLKRKARVTFWTILR